MRLIDIELDAITSGNDAVGEAKGRIRSNGTICSGGEGSATGINEAAKQTRLAPVGSP